MKNWNTLEADIDLIMNKHYTARRSGRKIDKIIIHHNAGNLTISGIWDVWQTRPASAHYQVDSNGRIGQLVWDRNTAWHAGNWEANTTSIGIEHADVSRARGRYPRRAATMVPISSPQSAATTSSAGRSGERTCSAISTFPPPNAQPRWQVLSMLRIWRVPNTGTTR